jgi:hypothetical protein
MNAPQSPGHEFWESVIRDIDKSEFTDPIRTWMKQNPQDLWITSVIGKAVIKLYNKAVIENEWEGENIVMLENRELRR